MARRVIFYGGSFDPFTLAHLAVVESIANTVVFDELIIAPVAVHAYGKQFMASFGQRIMACQLSVAHLKHRGVHASDADNFRYSDLARSGSTFDLLSAMQKSQRFNKNSDAEFLFVVGQDQAEDIANLKWHRSVDLVSTFRAIIIPRANGEITPANCAWAFHNGHLVLPNLPASVRDISSTKARQALASGDEEQLALLLPEPSITLYKGL